MLKSTKLLSEKEMKKGNGFCRPTNDYSLCMNAQVDEFKCVGFFLNGLICYIFPNIK